MFLKKTTCTDFLNPRLFISFCLFHTSQTVWPDQSQYRKTPLISTYVFSGLATEQVLIFGAVLIFGGMIRRRQKSCKEGVCSIQCFPHTARCCACFSDYVHTSRIQGYLYSGGMYFRGIATNSKFQWKLKGYLFSEGYLFTGFYNISRSLRTLKRCPFLGCVLRSLDHDLSDFGCPLWKGLDKELFLHIHTWSFTYNGLTMAGVRALC